MSKIEIAHQLQAPLNSYLHRLLEVKSIYEGAEFLQFCAFDCAMDEVEGYTFEEEEDPNDDTEEEEDNEEENQLDEQEILSRRNRRRRRARKRRAPLSSTPLSSTSHSIFLPQMSSSSVTTGKEEVSDNNNTCGGRCITFGDAITLSAYGGLSISLLPDRRVSSSSLLAMVGAGASTIATAGLTSSILAGAAAMGGGWAAQSSTPVFLSVSSGGQRHPRSSFILQSASVFCSPRQKIQYHDELVLFSPELKTCLTYDHLYDESHHRRSSSGPRGGQKLIFTLEAPARADFDRRDLAPGDAADDVRCGSEVYLVSHVHAQAASIVGAQDGFLTTASSPIVIRMTLDGHSMCHLNDQKKKDIDRRRSSPEYYDDHDDHAVTSLAENHHPCPLRLRVISYNVWMLPDLPLLQRVSPHKDLRAKAIPKSMPFADVVIFAEAFDTQARRVLIEGMKSQGYLYTTQVIGQAFRSLTKFLNGGVFAMSRYPIMGFDQCLYGASATGLDRLSDKGILYFHMLKNQSRVHIFGTHLQAWDTREAKASRATQLSVLRKFIDSKAIPAQDVLLILGDLNVNSSDQTQYHDMLSTLSAVHPPGVGPVTFSVDAVNNRFAMASGLSSSGQSEMLDYTLYSRDHRQPVLAESEIMRLQTLVPQHVLLTPDPEGQTTNDDSPRENHETTEDAHVLLDLSDHYPVLGSFHFP